MGEREGGGRERESEKWKEALSNKRGGGVQYVEPFGEENGGEGDELEPIE